MAITRFRKPKMRGTLDYWMRNFTLFGFCSSQNLLKMHVAPGNRNLVRFWVFFGLTTSRGRERPGA